MKDGHHVVWIPANPDRPNMFWGKLTPDPETNWLRACLLMHPGSYENEDGVPATLMVHCLQGKGTFFMGRDGMPIDFFEDTVIRIPAHTQYCIGPVEELTMLNFHWPPRLRSL